MPPTQNHGPHWPPKLKVSEPPLHILLSITGRSDGWTGWLSAAWAMLRCTAGAKPLSRAPLEMRAACMHAAYDRMQAAYDGKMQPACKLHASLVGSRLYWSAFLKPGLPLVQYCTVQIRISFSMAGDNDQLYDNSRVAGVILFLKNFGVILTELDDVIFRCLPLIAPGLVSYQLNLSDYT